jgi:hypothetical protein
MPKPRYVMPLLVIVFIAISNFVISLWNETESTVQAQTNCGGKPQTFSEKGYPDPYWSNSTQVKVFFESGDFTQNQRNTYDGGD